MQIKFFWLCQEEARKSEQAKFSLNPHLLLTNTPDSHREPFSTFFVYILYTQGPPEREIETVRSRKLKGQKWIEEV